MDNILITGITGQDGLFLTSKILNEEKNSRIFGLSRNTDTDIFYKRLNQIYKGSLENLTILNINLEVYEDVFKLISNINPTAIFNLTGPSSVYDSLKDSNKSKNSIINIFENLTSALLKKNNLCNFFQASSSEMFENISNDSIDENTNMIPNSPYALGKLINHKKVIKYSKDYDWNIVSGIMFNHESEFRDKSYLTQKIINAAYDISLNKAAELKIGSLEYTRDWSFAGDIVNAMFTLLKNDAKGPYVIGSGVKHSIKDMVEIVFNEFDITLDDNLIVDSSLLRNSDPVVRVSNPKKIYKNYGWKYDMQFYDLLIRCVDHKKKFT
tara:strand:- start:78 stop:1052 length:975 start_codon:yes stop_codon:yes gene_type:complete